MKKHPLTILSLYLILLAGILPAQELPTPLEKSNFSQLTHHTELLAYLRQLDQTSDVVSLNIIGRSVQGKEIPALFFSLDKPFAANRRHKPLVLIFCQQHGNEPSGKEAALMLARDLTGKRQALLRKLDLILVPQVNPDGADADQRRNANGMDLNRNHAILSEPETRALHDLFREWMPEVILDVHEYNAVSDYWMQHGIMKNADEQLGGLTNLNVDHKILEFSRKVMIPDVGQKVREAGYTFHRYVVGTPFEGDRMRYSTTAINDGRQSMGIYNTLSFILEGKRYGDVLNKIRRRSEAQLAAMTGFLQTVAEHAPEILQTVGRAREALLQSQARPLIQMDYFPDSSQTTVNFPIFNLRTWRAQDSALANFHPLVKAQKSVPRPAAYLIPPTEERLLEILSRHKIQMQEIPNDTALTVEIYRILHIASWVEEELTIPCLDVEKVRETRQIPAGTRVIPLNQPAGNLLPLLLEPQSSFSLMTKESGRKYRFKEYLKEGMVYPIYRK